MPASSSPPAFVRARAKVNLSLHVTGRRADGYHELDGLTAFAEAGDTVRAEAAEALSLDVEGPFAGALADEADNLVLHAARALAARAGVAPAARLTLDKRLPVAAGLGGGSADAAAALRALQALWQVELPEEELAALALELGADVPICLYGGAAFVSGIGERIGPAPHLPPAWLVLVNPGVALSTAAVFRGRGVAASPPVHRWTKPPADAAALADWLCRDGNDLEPQARALAPQVDAVLERLAASGGCLLARMSGSGATCFGLYPDAATAEAAAARLSAAQPEWWVQAARLVG